MYIEKIKSPADLKKLDLKELQVVADETRQAVLNRVSKHGGHVGPNLGFVEATVALHYVFDAPKDKLVFDVSHQCYPHKVLTGRAAGFLGDVDDMNAISGYSSPAECPEYDNFEVGHTSTSFKRLLTNVEPELTISKIASANPIPGDTSTEPVIT